MIKRYNLETQYNKFACEDQVVLVEDTSGDWVKWVDVVDLMTKALHNSVNLQMNIDIQNVIIDDLRKRNEELHEALHLAINFKGGK